MILHNLGAKMNNTFGMPTLLELDSLEKNIKFCKKLGLDFIEINLNFPYCNYSEINGKDVGKILDENGIFATVHFPEEINLASFHPKLRAANIHIFEEVCIWANEFSCNKITVHLNDGVMVTLPNGKVKLHDVYSFDVLENLKESFSQMAVIASRYNITICVENTSFDENTIQIFNEISTISEIGFTWDIGHDSKNGGLAGMYYSKNSDMVKHMHIHDYNGKSDHLSLFDGNLNINKALEFARNKNLLTVIEVKSVKDLEESVRRLEEKRLKEAKIIACK